MNKKLDYSDCEGWEYIYIYRINDHERMVLKTSYDAEIPAEWEYQIAKSVKRGKEIEYTALHTIDSITASAIIIANGQKRK